MSSSRHSRVDPPATASDGRPSRLDSWKEIAAFLGRSEKTVRRWEETEGLPVRRLYHEKRASVYAYTSELEQWRETRKPAADPDPALAEVGQGAKTGSGRSANSVAATPSSRFNGRLLWPVALGIIAISGLGVFAGIFLGRSPSSSGVNANLARIQSLAVLPFKNLSGDVEQEYFLDGITDEFTTALARISSVRLISRTSVMRYKNARKSVPEVTRELNVDAVVQGTVVRSGNRIRLSVQLVTPTPERHIWAGAYEGDIRELPDLQWAAAHELGSKLGGPLTARSTLSSPSAKRLDPDTYESYLRARHFLERRNAEAMKKALGYFQAVLRRDPGYAPAYSGMAVAYDVLGAYEVLPSEKSFPNARSFASRALELDDTLSEAYTARAIAASFWEFDWSGAERDFQRAITLDPSSESAHHWHAEYLISIANADRAVGEMERARELDPLSLVVNASLGRVYRDARRYGQAMEQCRKTLDLDPNIAMGHWCFGQVYIGEHRFEDAVKELELANSLGTTPLIVRDLACAYAETGRKDKASSILAGMLRKTRSEYMSPYSIGVVQAALGQKDKAFQNLERALAERDGQITYLALDPQVDALRSDPRFQSLLHQLHIPR